MKSPLKQEWIPVLSAAVDVSPAMHTPLSPFAMHIPPFAMHAFLHHTHSPYGQTDACENITFPDGKKYDKTAWLTVMFTEASKNEKWPL